jgi:glycosyltransferase involved in cell wall biosynthesis
MAPRFSIIVPAHNEAQYLAGCLDAIDQAAARSGGVVEVIVVLNRCTDDTERIARDRGARIAHCEGRNLAAIRNAGAALAKGEILVTIDADSRMSENALAEAGEALASGRYVGGGVPIHPERKSPAIVLTGIVILSLCAAMGIPSAGMFWCYRRDFEAVGGFNETKHTAEDIDFALRLKAHGAKDGRRYGTLKRASLLTSCRKFDQFGDGFAIKLMLRHPIKTWRGLHGLDEEFGNRYWYDVGR